MNTSKKIVVFDLDETLGYFTEFGIFCDCLDKYFKNDSYSNTHFKELLDLYPEYTRPKIIENLSYLKEQKKSNRCFNVMIYTNNNGPKSWAKNITDYFDTKVNYKLFDQIISAFKIKGKTIELGRTSHDKTIEDFFRCTKLPNNVDICFIDDIYHRGMSDDRVYYINVKPYYNTLSINTLILRLLESSSLSIDIKNKEDFIDIVGNEFEKYQYNNKIKSNDEQEIDTIIGKKLLQNLKQFFYDNNNKSLSRKKRKKNKSLKINHKK